MSSNDTGINNPDMFKLLFACLVNKLGGSATITQADIDDAAYRTLMEEFDGEQMIYILKKRTQQ